jgi:hypothetical protein
MTGGNRSADLAIIVPQYDAGYFSLNGTSSVVSGYLGGCPTMDCPWIENSGVSSLPPSTAVLALSGRKHHSP